MKKADRNQCSGSAATRKEVDPEYCSPFKNAKSLSKHILPSHTLCSRLFGFFLWKHNRVFVCTTWKNAIYKSNLYSEFGPSACVYSGTTFMCAKCSFCLCVCKENTFNCVAILYNMRWPLETVAVYYKHTHKNSTANKRKTEQNMGRKWLHDGHKYFQF